MIEVPREEGVIDEGRTASVVTVADGSASSWKVRVVVCGTHAGDYEHPNYKAARADADEREKKYGVLGCHYRVLPPAGNLWCAMCGHWTDHQSGTCPELLPQNAEVSDGGPLTHESTETRTRRSLH